MSDRTCLRCDKPFQSTGKFHRICERCRKINHKLSGVTSAKHQQFRKGNNGAGRSD